MKSGEGNSKYSTSQEQTKDAFGYKWKKRDTFGSSACQEQLRHWLLQKYFDGSENTLLNLLGKDKKRILDAGCGAGQSILALFGDLLKQHDYIGIDISEAASVCEEIFKEKKIPGTFLRCGIEELPVSLGKFDIIFSEGVLHHTDSTKKSILDLASRLMTNGRFLFYVYLKKAPIREYTDDLIREAISGMDNQQAWDALVPLTEFGKILGELNLEVEIKKPISFLGIQEGKINIQRLFYYKIFKAFYHENFTIEEMNHINFDWFRPKNCHRHTPDEIKDFCKDAGLLIERLYIDDSGISVISRKV